MVERKTVNFLVSGSSPDQGAIFFGSLIKAPDCSREVVGKISPENKNPDFLLKSGYFFETLR